MSDTETPTPTEPPPAAEWSQDKIDRLAGRARDEGRKTAQQELLAELGADNLDTIKAQLAAAAEREQADKTEAERARDEATAAKAEADRLRTEADLARLAVRVDRALIEAGVTPTLLGHASKLVDVPVDVDDDTLTATIAALAQDVAPLFASSEGAPPAPSSVPAGGTGAKPPSSKAGLDKGREAAAARFGTT